MRRVLQDKVENALAVALLSKSIKRGQRVTGTFGTSRLWDKLARGGFVSDAFVHTGSDGRVAPWCD